MNRLHVTLLSFCLLLAACGSVPPAPVDRFYRLQPVSVSSASKVLPGAVAVQTFRADSLYAERPIIHAEETSLRQLRQYHYHLWLYPPAQMVQGHFVSSLGGTLDFQAVAMRITLWTGASSVSSACCRARTARPSWRSNCAYWPVEKRC